MINDAPSAGGRSAFVGREQELATLLRGLSDARAGRGRFIALVGDAGIGKTRTLEEFVERAALPEERVLWGRCPEHHGLPAYWPWTQAVGRFVEQCDDATLRALLGRGAAELVQFVPPIADRLPGLEPPEECDPAQSRLRLFDSIAAFLRRVAADHPLVLVLDDLHWADEGSILLLSFVASELRRCRVLVLGTYREREMQRSPRLLGDLTRASERVALAGLALAEAEDLVRRRSERGLSPALLARLHRISHGNPFFLDALVQMLRSDGRLEREDGDLEGAIPDEVRQVVRRNLEPLSADDRTLLRAAAVIGYEFDVARLQTVLQLAPDHVLERLQNATQAGAVEEVALASGQFRFVHMLVRDALYGELLPLDRARLHRQVGLALEEMHGGALDGPWGELARHFVHAAVLGESARALDYATRAGEQALRRLAYEEAAGHFEVALKVLRLGRSDERRELELRMKLGDAQTYAGDHPRARATFERAAERARAMQDAPALARAAIGFGEASPGIGAVYPALVALLEESLRALPQQDGALRSAVLANLSSSLYFSREEERRERLSAEAVAMARRVRDVPSLAHALLQRHHVLWSPGHLEERFALCAEMSQLAAQSGHHRLELHAQLWRLVNVLEAGKVDELDRYLDTFARESAHARIPLYRWFAAMLRAVRAYVDGRFADAARLADEALPLWNEGALGLAAQTRALQRFVIYRDTGVLGDLDDTFATMADAFPAIPGWRSGIAYMHATEGRPEEARVLLEVYAARAFADLPRDAMLLSSLATFAEVAHALGDAERAALLHAALLPSANAYVSVGFAAGSYGSCAYFLGLLAECLGRLDEAAQRFDAALAANQRFGSRPAIARTQAAFARVLRARNQGKKADELLAEALRTAEQIGLARVQGRVEAPALPAARGPRTTAALFRKGESGWTVAYDGRTVRLKHAKGNDYLCLLLQSPGRDVHVLDLAMGGAASTPSLEVAGGAELQRSTGGDAGDLIDPQARVAYKRRLEELREELEEAQSFNDVGRAEGLQQELEVLTRELSRAIGLGGRHRKAASDTERARINVSRAIAASLKKIAEEHPVLGEHLEARVHTGTFCSYTPDPALVVEWAF